MKVLIIDNNIDRDCWGSDDLRRLAALTPGVTLYVRRAPQGDLPKSPHGYDRIIISGSKTDAQADAPWISQLITFLQDAVHSGKPVLGICYGHQMLARVLGGKSSVSKSKNPEFGWTKIEVVKPASLLTGLPKTFYSFSAHFDEVVDLPRGVTRLAFSRGCHIQAYQLDNFRVYGIQFHPEKSVDAASKILQERKRKKNPPELLNPGRGEKLYDPKIGETLFKNFLSM